MSPLGGGVGFDWFETELVSTYVDEDGQPVPIFGGWPGAPIVAVPVLHLFEDHEQRFPANRGPAEHWNAALADDEEVLLALVAVGLL